MQDTNTQEMGWKAVSKKDLQAGERQVSIPFNSA